MAGVPAKWATSMVIPASQGVDDQMPCSAAAAESGEVAVLVADKGFGLIRVVCDPRQVFFHLQQVVNRSLLDVELKVGSKVQFCRKPTKPDCRTLAEDKPKALLVFVGLESDSEKCQLATSDGGEDKSAVVGLSQVDRVDKSQQPARGWRLSQVVDVLPDGGGYLLKEVAESATHALQVHLDPGLLPKCLPDLEVGDEVQFMFDTNSYPSSAGDETVSQREFQGPRARRVQVLRFMPRTSAYLARFLNQLTAESTQGSEGGGGALPSATLTQLLAAARPLWRLLLEAAELDDDLLGEQVRSLVRRDLTEAVVRMRETARSLAKDLVELPYFSDTGPLAGHIQDLVTQSSLIDGPMSGSTVVGDQLAAAVRLTSVCSLLESLLAAEPGLACRLRPLVSALSRCAPSPELLAWICRMFELSAAGADSVLMAEMSWDRMQSLPEAQELMGPTLDKDPRLKAVRRNEPYASEEEYMDTYFRLLRVDCFSAIQKGIKRLLKGKLDERDMKVFYRISLVGCHTADGGEGGLLLALTFHTLQTVRRWETFSSLMYGNLVCLSPRGRFDQADLIWAVVADRDTDLLASQHGPTILVKLLPEFNSLSDTEVILRLMQAEGTTVMVESPKYFTAFRHVLDTLQKFDMKKFPLKKEIVFCQAEPDSQPQYLTAAAKVMDLKHPTGRGIVAASVKVANIEAMLASSGLDPSQQAALAHALTHRLAIIQGPPGCGKTYVGIRLVELLLSMVPMPRTPILVLTYKNHALDEFLKGLLSIVDSEDMVRIGAKSRVAELESCNLKNINQKCVEASVLDQINCLKEVILGLNREVTEAMLALQKAGVLTVSGLLDIWTEDQVRNFLLTAPYGREAVSFWFAWGQFATGQNVRELLANTSSSSSVCHRVRSGLMEERNGKEANQVCQLFQKVLNYWAPPVSYFAQLKELQAHFTQPARAAQNPHQQSPQDEDEDESEDEEVIENIFEARLAAQGRSLTSSSSSSRRKGVFFSQNQTPYRLVRLQDFPPNLEANEQLLGVDNFWCLNTSERIHLLYTILSQKVEERSASLSSCLEELDSHTKYLEELKVQMKAGVLRTKKIIGMTITGASINHDLIQEVAPAIVIVEEAAEVLEVDLLAALTPGLQHLVLIGDHKQLRPKVSSYKLMKDYNFDLSMMERLIRNRFPFRTLHFQNRMRPEISKLLLDIYPDLLDNLDIVKENRPADGLVNSVFFWNHDHEERGGGRSFSNGEEARRTVFLAEFLMATGIAATQITILTAYQGQVTEIRKLMHARGEASLQKVQQGRERGRPAKNGRVNVTTIDVFQGDENDFIIVSLVRCNSGGAIGFLAEESRRCVAQSRARCGLFLIGSAATFGGQPSSSWVPLLKLLNESGLVSKSLAVQCARHMAKSVVHIPDADAFEKLTKEQDWLCKLACSFLYSCRLHRCTEPCMSVHVHTDCKTMVKFPCSACGFVGEKKCYEDAAKIACVQLVELEHPGCHHKLTVKCCQKQQQGSHRVFSAMLCQTKINTVLPACGHTVSKLCHANLSDVICKAMVYYTGKCGHALSRECHLAPGQVTCNFQPCGKLRHCGHPCEYRCAEPCDQGDCSACYKDQELRRKENQERAKMSVKKLRQQMACGAAAFSRKELDPKGDPEYLTVYDRVTKYVVPDQKWTPRVTKIEKVHNPELEARYEEYKSEAYGDLEDFKFHGTDDAGVEGITKNGFRIGKAGMYGAGIYFATDSSKSSQATYTKGSNKLLLCKVFLGRAKVVLKADHNLSGKILRAGKYDSVFAPRNTKGSGGVLNDEFVVFDPRQAVVQYVIHYSSSPLSSSLAGLPGASALTATTTTSLGQSFRKVRLTPGRTINLNDALENTYRFAEGHFHRMKLKYSMNNSRQDISAITVIVNPQLAAKFELKKQAFAKEKKGDVIFAYHGTKTDTVVLNSILEFNFQQKFWSRQVHGPGNYFSEFPDVSLGYGGGLILCQLLPGKEYTGPAKRPPGYDSKLVSPDKSGSAQMVIIEDADQILPFCVLHLAGGASVSL